MDLTEFLGRLARWPLDLGELNTIIEYQSERVHVVPDALFEFVLDGAPPQVVLDEICSFNDPVLLFRPCATAKLVPTPSPTVSGPPDDDVVPASTRAQRTDANTDPSPPSSSSDSPSGLSDVNEFEEKCWDDMSDMNSFDIERAADAPT